MCPICGIVSRNDEDVSRQISSMMGTLGSNSSAEAWLVYDGMPHRWSGQAQAITRQALGQVSFATKEQGSVRPGVNPVGNLSILFEGNLYYGEKLRLSLASKQDSANSSAAEIVACLLAERYQASCPQTVHLII